MLGNVASDPEFKSDKWQILNFRLACNQKNKKKDGSVFEETCFIDVSMFGFKAQEFATQLQKGMQVLVDGRLKLDSWKTQEGESRSKHKILADNIILEAEPVEENGLRDKIEDTFGGF